LIQKPLFRNGAFRTDLPLMKNRIATTNDRAPAEAKSSLRLSHVLLAAGLSTLAACSSVPKPDAPQAAPANVSLEEWMERGAAAAKAGNAPKAREAWQSAARNYPAAKQPWLKLSEDYFNAGDYGNAVIAAQEALQREPRDRLANSVIAVSGLRLTAASLTTLRDEGNYAVGSRDEAILLTRSLRDALGEAMLVPQGDAQKRLKRPLRPVQANAEPAPSQAVVKPVARPSVSAVPSSANPLDKLR
jgi:tetratricopeptide (TPR) repeat protein